MESRWALTWKSKEQLNEHQWRSIANWRNSTQTITINECIYQNQCNYGTSIEINEHQWKPKRNPWTSRGVDGKTMKNNLHSSKNIKEVWSVVARQLFSMNSNIFKTPSTYAQCVLEIRRRPHLTHAVTWRQGGVQSLHTICFNDSEAARLWSERQKHITNSFLYDQTFFWPGTTQHHSLLYICMYK